MAAAQGAVIACHTKDEFDAQMAKGKEAGKLVRHLNPVIYCCLGKAVRVFSIFVSLVSEIAKALFRFPRFISGFQICSELHRRCSRLGACWDYCQIEMKSV